MRNSGKQINESMYGLFRDMPKRDKKVIRSAQMVPTNANQCRVFCDGSSVYSNAKFHCGDIVEICPVRDIEKNSLYTREVRDMAFEVEPDTKYVVPLGYCQYYNIVDKQHPVANCEYEWDADKKVIVIRANCTIPKMSILILDLEK